MILEDVWADTRISFKTITSWSSLNTNSLIGYWKRSKNHYRKSVSFGCRHIEKLYHFPISLFRVFQIRGFYRARVHSQNRRCRSMRCAASRPSLDHLAPVFAPVVSRCVISFPVGLILTPLIAGTQWDIAAGGESIFTHPEIDRPRNESLHREGESGLQRRRDVHPHSQWNFLTLLTYLQRFANIITSSAYVG